MSYKKHPNFKETAEGEQARLILLQMEKDFTYNTGSSYAANIDKHPDHKISFTDKHMDYLQNHPSVNPDQYIANLRLMSRVR